MKNDMFYYKFPGTYSTQRGIGNKWKTRQSSWGKSGTESGIEWEWISISAEEMKQMRKCVDGDGKEMKKKRNSVSVSI